MTYSKELIEFGKIYSKNPKGMVLISGKNGTGKTTFAFEIYNFITPMRLPFHNSDLAIFKNCAVLQSEWQKAHAEFGHAEILLEGLCKTPFLVLDDLGTRTPSDAFANFLLILVDSRWQNRENQGTLITTNLNSVDLRLKFGDAFFSRAASGFCSRLDGQDHRFNVSNSSLKALKINSNDPSNVPVAIKKNTA